MLPKIDDLQPTFELHGVDLAFITETWLNENIDDAAVELPNYTIVRRDKSLRIGAGVCAYINSCIPYKVLHELHDDDFETLWIYIRPHKLIHGYSYLIVCIAYIPPNCDKNDFIEHLTVKLDSALRSHPNAGIFI